MLDDSILGCAATEYGVSAAQQFMEVIAEQDPTIQIPVGWIKEVIGAADNICEQQAHHEEAEAMKRNSREDTEAWEEKEA